MSLLPVKHSLNAVVNCGHNYDHLSRLTLKSVIKVSIALVFIGFSWGCDTRQGLPHASHRVVDVEDTDQEMNEAMAKANETFSYFEQNWKRNDIDGFSVKLEMETITGETEHIWFTPVKIGDDEITATCANDPVSVPDLKLGDLRTVNRSAVSDWMILENGRCYGGYTIRVLSERDPASAPPLEFADLPEMTN